MLPQTQEVRAVCQHEAAHAVVALALGHDVDWIEINDTPEGFQGSTRTFDDKGRDLWDPSAAVEDLMIAFAGPCLDMMAGRIQPGSVHDMARVNSLSAMLDMWDSKPFGHYLQRAKWDNQRILEANKEVVFELCDYLMESDGVVSVFGRLKGKVKYA